MHRCRFPWGLAVALLAGTVSAFRDWDGFRFGPPPSASSENIPWSVAGLGDGRVVVAGQTNDSACCRLDTAGVFGGPVPPGFRMTPFLGFPSRSPSAWNPILQWGEGSRERRWLDLQPGPRGGFLTVGTIADTILLTGTHRIWRGGWAPDSTSPWDSDALFSAGGSGALGVGVWSDSGMRLRHLRTRVGLGRVEGRQILTDSSGFTIAGSIAPMSDGWMFDGPDSFAIRRSTGDCFAYHSGPTSRESWWTTLPCRPMFVPGIVRTPQGLWMAFNDSASGDSASPAPPWARLSRPGLALIDPETGRVLARRYPFGDMRGVVRAIAADEEGNLLLQGEQGSTYSGPGGESIVVRDTVRGMGLFAGNWVAASGWVAALDPSGGVRAFRQLRGLESHDGWKLRPHPLGGWLGLSWDETNRLGFSRLHHFDDSLGLVESSPLLPAAVDLEVGEDGKILLSGWNPADLAVPSWLGGSGSMWLAFCRTGTEGATEVRSFRERSLRLLGNGSFREIVSAAPGTIHLRFVDPEGRILLDRMVQPGAMIPVPRGLSSWVARQGGITSGGRTLRP